MIAFDIETTGLSPWEHAIRAISWAKHGAAGVFYGNEYDVLKAFDDLMAAEAEDRGGSHAAVTWNGHEFDLPFLAVRHDQHFDEGSGLRIVPTGAVGKYGNPLYRGDYYGLVVDDIAPAWKDYAERNDIKWSLKPVAEHVGLKPITLELEVLLGADITPVLPYAVSDALITRALAKTQVPA